MNTLPSVSNSLLLITILRGELCHELLLLVQTVSQRHGRNRKAGESRVGWKEYFKYSKKSETYVSATPTCAFFIPLRLLASIPRVKNRPTCTRSRSTLPTVGQT